MDNIHTFQVLFNAKNAAKDEQRRYEDAVTEMERLYNERREKARLRHKHAREKELLKQVTIYFCLVFLFSVKRSPID